MRSSRFAIALLCVTGAARAQTQIKARVLVMVDTSGSMVWHFNNNTTCGGDGDFASLFTDVTQANKNFYPGNVIAGAPDGKNSRLYAAKAALFNVINSTGDIDFGVERYAPDSGLCQNLTNCCNFATGACVCQGDYINNPRGNVKTCVNGGGRNNGLITWAGACGPFDGNGNASDGGQILVLPAPTAAAQVLSWVDNVEDFRAGGPNGFPLNGELRAAGNTPLAGSVRTATNSWYLPILNHTRANPKCNPNSDPLCDPQIDCRPYVFVAMTDGADTCDSDPVGNPPATVAALSAANATNPVKTYVIGLAFMNGDPAIGVLNNMAANGGSGQARFANNQQDIEAAFADIVASSVKFEQCNAMDDNCNNLVDEGLGVYQECAANNQCASNVCDMGRCTCASNAQCNGGFLCAAGFCVPSCTVGQGLCLATGVEKCGLNGPTCCKNDGNVACVPLAAGMPTMEICNGLDDDCNGIIDDPPVCQVCTPTTEVCDGRDNDCNGKIDDNLTDTGQGCGLNLGVCKPGTTVCVNGAGQNVQAGGVPDAADHLMCQGGVQPMAPQCNGCDNDCDGVTDAPDQACYGGPNGTDGVGVCHGGLQKCAATMCPQAAQWGPCVGEVDPSAEICNGLDDDCNGMVDDLPGANVPCCPSGKCGVGICTAGTMLCSGGSLQCIGGQGPTVEVCNGLDDDCNGMVDDLPSIGKPCVPMNGGCGGTLQCDVVKMMIVCQPNGMGQKEICNGVDDDCDGFTDEEPDIDMNDNRLNQPCGNPNNLPLPCKAGTTICKNGQVVCDGAVGPGTEVCNGKDDDCDGMADDMAPCPMGFLCFGGQCDPLCDGGEFPCPGGYTPSMANGVCVCVPDKTCDPACQSPLVCDPASGTCVDPCAKVSCPNGLTCLQGSCVGCEQLGCSGECQRCDRASHLCAVDKCCNVQCGQNGFCDSTTGMCAQTCPNGCPTGQVCQDGACAGDPCAGVSCPEGQSCDSRDGKCQADACINVMCAPNLTCCGNACVADPCKTTVCPQNTFCHVNTISCQVSCDAVPEGKRDEVVGAGGGGFGCSVGAGAGGRAAPVLVLFLFGLALARRRSTEVK